MRKMFWNSAEKLNGKFKSINYLKLLNLLNLT